MGIRSGTRLAESRKMDRAMLRQTAFVLVLAAVLAACSGAGASPSPAAPASPAGVVVTFRVVDLEEYRIRLTDPVDIAIARKLLAGEPAPAIPNGKVVRGSSDVNTGYTWHIDPEDIDFADVTIELCDGRPSDVEKNQISGDRYCPWAAKVIKIDG